MKCEICGKTDFKNTLAYSMHIVRFHKLPVKEYYDTYIKTEEEGQCLTCKKPTTFDDIISGYHKFCNNPRCAQLNINVRESIDKTKEEKYGSKTYNNRKQATITSNEKYGNGNYNNRQKAYETHKERYGVEHPLQYKEFNDKAYNTRVELYGEYITDEMIQKSKDTKEENYGDPNYVNVELIRKTKLDRYGDENYNNVEKNRETRLNNNGGIFWTQEQIDKVNDNKIKNNGSINVSYSYLYNNIYFDSGWELAYYIWLTDNNISFQYHPAKRYEYWFKNKKHVYEPDFLINNELVELKNEYLMKKLLTENTIDNAKYQCMIDNNVKIITDCSDIVKYVEQQYGKNFIQQHKKSKKRIKDGK